MALIFQDQFTDANSTSLASHTPNTGTSWTQIINIAATMGIDTNELTQLTGSLSDGAFYTADVTYPTANYSAKVTLVSGLAGDDPIYLGVRVTDANNGYFMEVLGGTCRILKRVSGTWTSLVTFAQPANGSVLTLEANGTTIRVLDDGVEVATVSDSSHSAAGKAGVGMGQIGYGSGKDISSQTLDNFEVNTLNSPPSTPSQSSPADDATNQSKTPTMAFSTTDPESDDIRYELWYTTFVRTDALKAFWNANENTGLSLADATGNNNTLSYGTLSWSGSKIGASSVHINGSQRPNGSVSGLPTGSQSRTVSLWYKPAAFSGNDTLIGWGSASDGQAFGLQINSSSNFHFSGWNRDADWTVSWTAGTWYHIVLTYTGTTLELFINGVSQGTRSIGSSLNTSSSNVHLGQMPNGGAIAAGHDCDAFGIWDTVLTQAEIDLLYNSNTGLEFSSVTRTSGTDSGFTNATNGGDTDPFTSGDTINFTVQAGDILPGDTKVFWKVRAKDPSGTNTFSSYTGLRKFTTIGVTVLSITKSLQYAIEDTPSALTKSLQYTIKIVPTALTKAVTYRVKKSISVTKQLIYHIEKAISITKSLKYTTKTTPSAITKQLIYRIEKAISITKSLKYTVEVTPAAITKSLQYAVEKAIAITKSMEYALQTATTVNVQKSMRYAIIKTYSVTKSLQYAIERTPSAITKTLKYTVEITPTAITKSLSYAVEKSIAITKSLQYSIEKAIAITKSLEYIIENAVSITKSLKYTVETTPSAITKSLKYTVEITPSAITKSLRYAIFQGSKSITKSMQYYIEKSIAITKSLRYTIEKSTAITKSLQYATERATSITKSLQYYVEKTISITKSLQYTIEKSIAITKSLRYAIDLPVVTITKSLRYAVEKPIAITKSLQYSIEKTIAITKTMQYQLAGQGAVLVKSLKYTVKTSIAVTKSLQYTVRKTISTLQKSLSYTIKSTPASITKSLKYTLRTVPSALTKALQYAVKRTPVAITKSLAYAIGKSIAITKSLTYGLRISQTVTLQKTMQYVVKASVLVEKSLEYVLKIGKYVKIPKKKPKVWTKNGKPITAWTKIARTTSVWTKQAKS